MRATGTAITTALPVLGNAVGFGLVALSGFVFVAVVDRSSHGVDAAALTSYYFLINTVVLGIATGVEQATNRRAAFTIASGADWRRAVTRSIRDCGALVAIATAVLLTTTPILLPRTLRGHIALFLALVVGLGLASVGAVVRGLLVGARRFGRYAATWMVEGCTRVALVGAAMVTHRTAPWVLGVIYIVPYLASALVGVTVGVRVLGNRADLSRPGNPGPTGNTQRVAASGMAALASAGLLTLGVANLPQLVLGSRGGSVESAVVAFGQVFVLARIALVVLAPVQSVLLPTFTSAVAADDLGRLRRNVMVFFAVCVGVALVWTVVMTGLGPPTAALLFGGHGGSRSLFLVLSLGTVVMASCTPMQLALVALGRYRWVPVGWGVGVVATVLAGSWPYVSPTTAAAAAAVVGPCAVLSVMVVALWPKLLSGANAAGHAQRQDSVAV